MNVRPQERGMALLTVLALVAFIAVAAALSLERLKLSTRVATNIAALDQARAYGYVAESIVLSRVATLASPEISRTTLDSGLIATDLPFPVERGSAVVRIEDGGNCFNVNSVVQGETGQPLTVRPAGQAQLETLILLLGGQPAAAKQISASLGDWIDSDSLPSPGGAEDATYLAAKAPYRTANVLMVDPAEVRSVAGMTPEIYAKLRPWLCALPDASLSPINVNTLLPEQSVLIAMLFGGQIDANGARRMIDARPRGGYASAVDFWKLATNAGIAPPETVQAQTQVKTRWFVLDASVSLAGADLRERALIDAGTTPARLVRRIYGDPE